MQDRIAILITRALLASPDILVLNQPTAFMCDKQAHKVYQTLALWQKTRPSVSAAWSGCMRTVFVNTYDIEKLISMTTNSVDSILLISESKFDLCTMQAWSRKRQYGGGSSKDQGPMSSHVPFIGWV